jgi:starch synthase
LERILFVASECTPFIKTGGLADVIGSLPQSLKEFEHMDVRVILPFYDEIDIQWKQKFEFCQTFDVKVGWRNQTANLFMLKHNQITYYFIANDYYFTRKGIYGYYDDGERFIFFSHAVIEMLKLIDFQPEILHAHDWQAGMTILLAKILEPIPGMKTVFTIHNLKYQGIMPLDMFNDFFRLSWEHLGGMEWRGTINCMKAALFHADKITTVSPSYAEEIKNPYYGEGLDPILNERSDDLTGILNGIDTKEYNPLTDPFLPVPFRSSRSKKVENKKKIQELLGLDIDGEKPLYVSISRLVEQKGFHLLQHIVHEFIQEDIQFILLGTGEKEFEDFFRELEWNYPKKVRAILNFDEGMARKLYGASDFFIMPSKFEPCGLSQLIALQYKSVPIVRETGGLKDTIIPYNELTGEGNGFSFANYNAHELLRILRYSLAIYRDPINWSQLLRNVNKSQFTWRDSALKYAELYRKVLRVPTFN